MMSQWLTNKIFCHLTATRLLSPYVDQELAAHKQAQLTRHMESCVRCRQRYQQLLFAQRAVKQITLPDKQPTSLPQWLNEDFSSAISLVSPKPHRLWIPLSAAAVILIATTFGVWLTRKPMHQQPALRVAVVRLAGAPSINQRAFDKASWLQQGDRLVTNADSRALITFGQFGQIETDADTQIELLETSLNNQRLALTRGKIYASITAPPRMFSVNTPAAAAIDLGPAGARAGHTLSKGCAPRIARRIKPI